MDVRDYCEICGIERAVYRCSSCGRRVCKDDFNLSEKVCIECYEARRAVTVENVGGIMLAGILSIVAILLLFIGFTFLLESFPRGESIVIIFPFIVISDPYTGLFIALVYAAVIIGIMALFVRYFLRSITG